MKHTNIPATVKAVMAILLPLLFVLPAQARKIYISKGSDNGVYLNGSSFSYAPGDTLVLRAAQNPFSYFSLENFHGTASARVVVINEGGQVRISAMAAKHCTFMKFTGSGSADQYGFYLTSPNQSTLAPAMCITGRSSDIEVDRLDIYDHGYGFWVKEEGSCDPTMQYPNWRMNNMSIHDCRMRNLKQEGIYAGSTAPNGERVVYCNGVPTYPLPIRLGNVKIYNNIIDRTGRGGIQLASCDFGSNEIWGNTVTNCGTEYSPSQGNGIVLGGYTTAYVHDNVVNNTFSTGIFSLGAGEVRIENNRVDNSGSLDGRTANGSASIMVDTRLTIPVMNTKFYVKNNVLGANTDFGIRVYDTYPTFELGNVICNNTKTTGGDATHYIQGATNWINCTAPQNASPTANPGPMQTITLPATLTLSGSGTDRDGTIASYQWAQMVGPSNVNFATPNAATTTVGNLVAGTYTFKLTVTDNGGATGSANVTITVNAAGTGGTPTTGTTTNLRIEAENFSSQSGIQTENCSEGGQNIGWQDNNDWMDYSVNLASAGSYNLSFRVASMFTGATFQLRNSAGTVLATVTVPNTGSFQGWTTANATATLPAGQQTLRIVTTTANGGWNINWWQIQGGSTTTVSNGTPVVNAGSAQTITLPTSSVTLTGSATDDGLIQTYTWSQVSGPANAVFSTIYNTTTSVSGLVAGTYVFRLSAKDDAGLTGTGDVTVTVNASGSTTTTGTTTRIEAENYSSMSGIQLEGCSEGGQNVAWQDNNDWMDYSVNLASAGSYTVNFRVASMFTGATFQLRNSAGTVLATITVPNTGSFQSWQTRSATVTLPAGQQTLRVVTTAANGGWNFNWFEIVGGGSTPPPPPAPTTSTQRIEAENYATMSGVQKESTSDAGGGQNVGWQDDNDWMDYPVSIANSGSYNVSFRVASMFTGAQFQLRRADGTVLTTVTVPNTGSFQSWQTVSANVTLPAGAQTLRVYTTRANGGWNFNWFEIGSAGSTSTASLEAEVVNAPSLAVFPNPVVDRFALKVDNDLKGTVSVQLFDAAGQLQKSFSLKKNSAGALQTYLTIGTLPKGTYVLKATMTDWTESIQLIKQ